MSRYVFKMPDLGEGTVSAEVVAWHVKPGDLVQEDQVMCEVMTEKAAVEMPAPVTGRILSITGQPGDMVAVGSELVVFDTDATSAAAGDAPAAKSAGARRRSPLTPQRSATDMRPAAQRRREAAGRRGSRESARTAPAPTRLAARHGVAGLAPPRRRSRTRPGYRHGHGPGGTHRAGRHRLRAGRRRRPRCAAVDERARQRHARGARRHRGSEDHRPAPRDRRAPHRIRAQHPAVLVRRGSATSRASRGCASISTTGGRRPRRR